MKKRNIIILIIIVVLTIGIVSYLSYVWYWATHTGSRSGRVIDAVTRKPIEGAVVNYNWAFSDFMTMPGGFAAFYETTTDKDGYYFIPNQHVKKRHFFFDALVPEKVIIYKDNYAVYTLWREYKKPPVGRSFGFPDKDQPYEKKNNLVKLYRWKKGESHDQHVDWIGCRDDRTLLWKELEPEKKRAEEERREKYRRTLR